MSCHHPAALAAHDQLSDETNRPSPATCRVARPVALSEHNSGRPRPLKPGPDRTGRRITSGEPWAEILTKPSSSRPHPVQPSSGACEGGNAGGAAETAETGNSRWTRVRGVAQPRSTSCTQGKCRVSSILSRGSGSDLRRDNNLAAPSSHQFVQVLRPGRQSAPETLACRPRLPCPDSLSGLATSRPAVTAVSVGAPRWRSSALSGRFRVNLFGA